MVGTLFNTVAVAVGASVGLAMGSRWSDVLKDKIFLILGLFTLAIGMTMAMETNSFIELFLALIGGTLLGHKLKLQDQLKRWTSFEDGPSNASVGQGFFESMVLFCMGSMTLVGCMEDGLLDNPNLLLIKGTMDLISSAFLAATLGRGVLWSAAGVLVFQGALTLTFGFIGQGMDPILIEQMSALGGIMMLGIGLQLLGVQALGLKGWPLVDVLPSLLLLPIIHWAHHLLIA